MKYEIINLKTSQSYGKFETLAEAKGAVIYDGLAEWEIWANGSSLVASRDSGRY